MPRAARTEPVAWVRCDEPGALAGVLTIGTGRSEGVYAVTELGCVPGRGFGLAKVSGGTDGEATGYAVRVTAGGLPLSCECKSWLVRGVPCRHLREIGRLVSEGKL